MLSVGSTPDGEWTVCEIPLSADPLTGKLVPKGELRFIHVNGSVAVFQKSSEAMYGCAGHTENATAGCFLGLGTGSDGVKKCQAGCQSELLKRNGDADPGYEQMKQLFSGMVFDGGWDERDPAHQGSWKGRPDQSEPGFNVHTWVGSRGTTQLPAFDSLGGDVGSVGMPSMNQYQETKYHRSDAVFKDPLSRFEQREGLWGGYLPVISLQFKIADHGGHASPCSSTPKPCPSHPGRTYCPSNSAPNQCDHPPAPCPPCPGPPPTPPPSGAGWIEFVACPVADMRGNYLQDVFFRITKFNSTGGVVDARYFDTYAFRSVGMEVAGRGYPAGSHAARGFYGALLDQKVFWEQTMRMEHAVQLELPRTNQTDGVELANKVYHSLVRDMIIRHNTWFPVYGVNPNGYGNDGNMNCDLTLSSSMSIALSLGAYEYATGVLENYFTFGYRPHDGPRYRGPSMSENGAHMEYFAQYWTATGDPSGIFTRHLESIMSYVETYRAIRRQALALPKDSPAYGIPAGNTIDDLWGSAVECGTTFPDGKGGPGGDCIVQLPEWHITWAMVSAFRAVGDVFLKIGASNTLSLAGIVTAGGSGNKYNLTEQGLKMLEEADELLQDAAVAANRSAVPGEGILINGRNVSCYPCHAGWGSCKTGFKHPGFIRPTADIMCKTMGVPAYACEPAGPFPKQLCDDISDYDRVFNGGSPTPPPPVSSNDQSRMALYKVFDTAANSMTRGTWTGAEVPSYGDPQGTGSGVSTVSTSRWPAELMKLLITEMPNPPFYNRTNYTLMLGGDLPRAWLSPGEHLGIYGAPITGGRMDMSIESTALTHKINVTLPAGYTWPVGGVVLRIRSPAWPQKKIVSATVGGESVPADTIDAAEETVSLVTTVGTAAMQSIVVTVG